MQNILIAVVDGLKGFPDAINFCAWKDRKEVAADLRRIYSAPTADQATVELDAFEEKWAGKYASLSC